MQNPELLIPELKVFFEKVNSKDGIIKIHTKQLSNQDLNNLGCIESRQAKLGLKINWEIKRSGAGIVIILQ